MNCQICHRQLEPLEPIYRMHFGPAINYGLRTSLCKRCYDNFVSKKITLISSFCEQHCEHCARPILTVSRWRPKRAICSAKCRGAIDTKRAKERRAWHRYERACWHCGKKFTPKRADGRYCSVACKQSAYRRRMGASSRRENAGSP
jgi:hypothetical protein